MRDDTHSPVPRNRTTRTRRHRTDTRRGLQTLAAAFVLFALVVFASYTLGYGSGIDKAREMTADLEARLTAVKQSAEISEDEVGYWKQVSADQTSRIADLEWQLETLREAK